MPWTVEASARAQREQHADRAEARSRRRSPITSDEQRRRARRPAISAPKISPSTRKYSDLERPRATPAASSRPSTSATRGMGEATRRSKKPPSISSARRDPGADAAEQQRLRDRGGELEVEEAVDAREARQLASSRCRPPTLTARNSVGKMTSGARNCGRRRALRSARRASATTAGRITPRLGARARPRPRPAAAGLGRALEVRGRSSRRRRRRASAARARARRPRSRRRRARGRPARRPRAPRGSAIDRWQPSRRRAVVAEARDDLARAREVAASSASAMSRCGTPTSRLQRRRACPRRRSCRAAMIPTRSASWSASSRYCVVRKTVVPSSLRRRTSSHSVRRLTRVQAGGRLVEEEDLGLVDERHREVEAAAHAAGVRADAAVGRAWSRPTRPMRSAPRSRTVRGGDAVQRRLQLHELAAGHEQVERGLLQRDADAAAHLARLRGDVEAGDARARRRSGAAA